MGMRSESTAILEKLQTFWRAHRRGPSYAELARLAGYASKQAAYRLAQKLIEAGILERDATGRLALRSAGAGMTVAGYVQAGFPAPAEEALQDTVSLEEFLIRKPEASFLVKVAGDSMIDAGIHPGDLVVVERGIVPKNGDIVLAHVDREWTLKYFQRRGGQVRLVPANPRYPEITAREELQIGGVVRASLRRY
ncbi:MAG: LexA family transcriptional regulator [Deltaproteobacteria bacterium]|nr:LexA family transcriptional regulator [Deltaproteobacteria bacterium]